MANITREQMIEEIEYLGIFLTPQSKAKLRRLIPAAFNQKSGDHITVVHGPDEDQLLKFSASIGKKVVLTATHVMENDRVQAIRIKDVWTERGHPHITISWAEGASPIESNALVAEQQGMPIQPWVQLEGIYDVFPRSLEDSRRKNPRRNPKPWWRPWKTAKDRQEEQEEQERKSRWEVGTHLWGEHDDDIDEIIWRARTVTPDGMIISSVAQPHQAFWSVDHVAAQKRGRTQDKWANVGHDTIRFSQAIADYRKKMEDHIDALYRRSGWDAPRRIPGRPGLYNMSRVNAALAQTQLREQAGIGTSKWKGHLPAPTREEVAEAHRKTVDQVLAEGIPALARRNPQELDPWGHPVQPPKPKIVIKKETMASIPVRCPFCKEPLGDPAQENLMSCKGCGAKHHQECYEEGGGCAIGGCKKHKSLPQYHAQIDQAFSGLDHLLAHRRKKKRKKPPTRYGYRRRNPARYRKCPECEDYGFDGAYCVDCDYEETFATHGASPSRGRCSECEDNDYCSEHGWNSRRNPCDLDKLGAELSAYHAKKRKRKKRKTKRKTRRRKTRKNPRSKKKKALPKKRKCGMCGRRGHNRRTCR
jgi:hypothetical protein